MPDSYWGNRNVDNKTEWARRARYKAPTASVGVVDSRHHIKDDTPLYFGYDSDFSMQYNTGTTGIILASRESSVSDTFMSFRNVGTEILGLSYLGELKLTNVGSLPTEPANGRIAFSGNDLYISIT